ncbi:YbhB/YbcL family Raf kinase inhibitor-like protein [Cupriavidus pinatubonensis]|nr:YbhB/YbcL family Raf kinase inhibitor-like protein [Cupriavidus pinatubonensis]
MKTKPLLHCAVAVLGLAGTSIVQAAPMTVSSAAFAENAVIPAAHGGNTPANCGGQGVSPPVAWTGLPAGTKSVAIFMFDPDGGMGLGFSHWVAYNIAADRGHLRQGEGQKDGAGITVGKNGSGEAAYRGPCPPVGDVPHHYIVTVVATDLEPGALPAALTRDELMAALKGHARGSATVVGRYGR